jgi:tetratricopeptide (TPR) repeat protein
MGIMGRWRIGILVALCMTLASPLWAQPVQPPARTPSPPLPWDKDVTLLQSVETELRSGGIKALASHMAEFEAALANGKQFFPDGALVDGKRYVLADGTAETLMMLLAYTAPPKKDPAVKTVAIDPNPYPSIGIELASYYDEVGQPEEAIRVLDESMALSPAPDFKAGAHVAGMIGEKGVALGMLKRFPEALATYDQGLTLKGLIMSDRTRLLRGRGFMLVEMGRLDEGEAAYREALKLDPADARALNELRYIARLRAGGPKTPAQVLTSPGPSALQPAPQAPGRTPI